MPDFIRHVSRIPFESAMAETSGIVSVYAVVRPFWSNFIIHKMVIFNMDTNFLEGLIIGTAVSSLVSVLVIWLFVKRIAARMFGARARDQLSKEISKALDVQRPVIKGKISEQLFPLLYHKTGNLADFRFIGSPVDYIVFEGLSEARDGLKDVINIRFVEIKTGNSGLNKAEKCVKEAVESKRISWEEVEI